MARLLAVAAAAGAAAGQAAPCLCVFDVDRTLTAKQEQDAACAGTKSVPGVQDTAYCKGTLTLSQLAQNIGSTFCGKCYMGVVSHGSAGGHGSKERDALIPLLNGTETPDNKWDDKCGSPVASPLVLTCKDGKKQDAVADIVKWYAARSPAVTIAAKDVYFYDDRDNNISPFKGTGFNAKQVSCGSRDADPYNAGGSPGTGGSGVGFCGGKTADLDQSATGVILC